MPRYIDRLILFEALRNDEVAIKIAGLITSGPEFCEANPGSCRSGAVKPHKAIDDEIAQSETGRHEAYYAIGRALLKEIGYGGISGNCLQGHLCRILACEDNIFARLSENGVFSGLSTDSQKAARKSPQLSSLSPANQAILKLAASEIKHISPIYQFAFTGAANTADGAGCYDLAGLPASETEQRSGLELIHQAMTQHESEDAAIMLAEYYHSYGSGIFGASSAFSAEEGGMKGCVLVPARFIDPVTLDDIIGAERQKKLLAGNMEILLSGLRANNTLLYGDSGTGKSSTVKALLNHYSSKGLKLISVSKENLSLLPRVIEQIADRGLKFIIFIDDLSFDENENEYKAFKSIVEGRVAPRPQNTVFVVTTNRKNIVKDLWGDRDGDDVRRRDNMEEKRSLADRFGLTLTYSAPTKQEYLAIVRGVAGQAGLSIPDDELAGEALKWELRHGGRSGRTARQFVDYMVGMKAIDLEDI